MHVVVPPVFIAGRILRVISSTPHLYEVEEWVGEWWEPSQVTLSVATSARNATAQELDTQGVPAEDRLDAVERLSYEQLSERLRAHVHDYTHELPSTGAPATGPRARRREYTGSGKFRRPRMPQKGAERRGATEQSQETAPWTGPLRRATDHTRETPS